VYEVNGDKNYDLLCNERRVRASSLANSNRFSSHRWIARDAVDG
jgi:hypothetical protein